MVPDTLSHPAYRRDLGDGLVLRWATAGDVERMLDLFGHVFRGSANDPPNERTVAYARDLMSGQHPLSALGEFALVEDTRSGAAVAATTLMTQTWDYAGIALPVGRPEIVASAPDYRNRGLVRAVFELIHARSAAYGHLAQGITGIPFYYRQFGYEYALDLGGHRDLPFEAIPKRKDDDPEPYALRDATADDLPQVLALYDRERSRAAISSRADAEYWRFTLDGHHPASGEGWRTQLIGTNVEGAWRGPVLGYVLTGRLLWGDTLWLRGLSLAAGVPLITVLPSVLRQLQAQAATMLRHKPDQPPPAKFGFGLGRQHALYDAFDELLHPGQARPYAWYVRVPDLPGFVQHVAPVLEQRLAASAAAGYTGDLKLTFYRGGLRLVFADGRLDAAEPWQDSVQDSAAMVGFPPLVFLQLLFCHRSLAALRDAFPDVWANETGRVLLEALFPPQLAWVLPLD